MVAITKLIIAGIAIVCALTLAFIVLEFVEDKVKSKSSKNRNHVKFYVARDKIGDLYLYIGKPIRGRHVYKSKSDGVIHLNWLNIKKYGLNEHDYDNLKWEDEPVEVFVNMED